MVTVIIVRVVSKCDITGSRVISEVHASVHMFQFHVSGMSG